MSMQINERNPNCDTLAFGSLGTSQTVNMPGKYFRKHSRIKHVWMIDSAGIAKDATQHVIVNLQDNAGSPVVYASVDTKDAAAVAKTPLALAPAAAINDSGEIDVPAGTMLYVSAQTIGTSVLTLAAVMIEWYPL